MYNSAGVRGFVAPGRSSLLGLPVGDFGLFASGLIAVALGLAGFCGSCFFAIVVILIYNSAGHHAVDYAISYRYVALPVGVAVMLGSGLVLAALWVRRQVRR